jgi:hypothetical protein
VKPIDDAQLNKDSEAYAYRVWRQSDDATDDLIWGSRYDYAEGRREQFRLDQKEFDDMKSKHRAVIIFLILLVVCLGMCVARADMGEIESAAKAAGRQYNINPRLILAVIEVESRYQVDAVGATHGEIGLMQLRPEFHECASFDVQANVECGTRYLAELRAFCKEDCGRLGWVALYNTGPRKTANRNGDYYRKVMRALEGA